jgi:hypothetical protein
LVANYPSGTNGNSIGVIPRRFVLCLGWISQVKSQHFRHHCGVMAVILWLKYTAGVAVIRHLPMVLIS